MRRRIRTTLSLLGVAVGIAAIVAFHSIGDGFVESIRTAVRETQAHVVMFSSDASDLAMSRVNLEDKRKVLELEGVLEVAEGTIFFVSASSLRDPRAQPGVLLFGRDPGGRLVRKYANADLEGRMYRNESEVMLGYLVARKLGKKPGDPIRFFQKDFTIAGVFKVGAPMENGAIVVANSVIQEELRMGDAFSIGFIYLQNPEQVDAMIAKIQAAIPCREVIQASEVTEHFSDQLQYIDWFVWIISLVAVIVGGLGVLNTMLMSVSERVREIGTLRAVGWGRGMVIRLILMEGLLITAAGGAVGVGVGCVGAEVLVYYAPNGFLAAVYPLSLFGKAAAVAYTLIETS